MIKINLLKHTKTCPKCKNNLPIENFGNDKYTKDGKYCYCKKCTRNNASIYRDKFRDAIRNRDKENKRILRRENPQKYLEIQKRYREKHGYHHDWADGTIRNHRERLYNIEFSREELINLAKRTKICQFCNKELSWYFGKGKLQHDSPTIDNSDLNENLNINNIQIICHQCNTTKSNRTMKGFVEYCGMIYNKYKEIK